MATYYVSSVSGDNSDGLTWATAKTSIAAGLALATADGDIIYVDSAHNFTSGAAIAWDAATANTHIRIISVNRNGSTGTGHSGWLSGASETVGVNAAVFGIANAARSQRLYVFGVSCIGNNGAGGNFVNIAQTLPAGAANTFVQLEFNSCVLKTPGTSTGIAVNFGTNTNRPSSEIKLTDCEISMRNAAGAAKAIAFGGCNVFIDNLTLSFTGATKPLSCFGGQANCGMGVVHIADSDLSGYDAASGAYFDLTANDGLLFQVADCKLSATPAITAGSWRNSTSSITLINVDSSDTKTVLGCYNRQGTLLATTSIYADDGAVTGGTNVGWQIVTTADANEQVPFVTPWIERWGGSTAAQDQSLEIIHDSATDLNNRNLWAEFEYVSNASFPQGTLLSVRNAEPFDGTAVDWPNSSIAWTGTGGFANPNKQTIASGSITPAEVSLLRTRLFVGVASKTLYLDPTLRIA